MSYLKIAADKIRNRVRSDGDAFIAVDGEERSGKSSFIILFASMIDPTFTLDNIVWRRGKLIPAIYDLPKYSAIVHDELGMDAINRRFMSAPNTELRQASMVWGDQNKVVIGAIPNFWELDPGLRNRRTFLWVHVEMYERPDGSLIRGYADFHYRKSSKWYPEPSWDEVCTQRYLPIPGDIMEAYKVKKYTAVREALREMEEDDMTWKSKAMMSYLRRRGNKPNQAAFCKAIGVDPATLSRFKARHIDQLP